MQCSCLFWGTPEKWSFSRYDNSARRQRYEKVNRTGQALLGFASWDYALKRQKLAAGKLKRKKMHLDNLRIKWASLKVGTLSESCSFMKTFRLFDCLSCCLRDVEYFHHLLPPVLYCITKHTQHTHCISLLILGVSWRVSAMSSDWLHHFIPTPLQGKSLSDHCSWKTRPIHLIRHKVMYIARVAAHIEAVLAGSRVHRGSASDFL